jgi:hypothetical protein
MRFVAMVVMTGSLPLVSFPVHTSPLPGPIRDPCHSAESLESAHPTLWRTVRAALVAQAHPGLMAGWRFRIEHFERKVAVGSGVIEKDERRRFETTDPREILDVPATQIEDHGFIASDGDSFRLIGPTPTVLLSSWFLSSHCLGATRERSQALMGLTFRPRASLTVTGVEGTVSVDLEHSVLRRIDFVYTNLPPQLMAATHHGALEYALLPGGLNILRSWHITSPIIERGEVVTGGYRRTVERIRAVGRFGDEVLDVMSGSDTLHLAARSRVSGIVYDSVSQVPLVGVRVVLAGTGFSSETDALGHYVLDEVPPGRYRIDFVQPTPTGETSLSDPIFIEVYAGQDKTVSLAIQSVLAADRIGRGTAVPPDMAERSHPGAPDPGPP